MKNLQSFFLFETLSKNLKHVIIFFNLAMWFIEYVAISIAKNHSKLMVNFGSQEQKTFDNEKK